MHTKILSFCIILVSAVALLFVSASFLGAKWGDNMVSIIMYSFIFLFVPFGYLIARIAEGRVRGLLLSFIFGVCAGTIILVIDKLVAPGGFSIFNVITIGISVLTENILTHILPIAFASMIGGAIASVLFQRHKEEHVSLIQDSQIIVEKNSSRPLQFLSRFILFVSVLYIIFGGFIIVPSLIMVPIWPVFIIAIIFSRFLPITQFGNPFEIGLSGVGVNENMFPLFGIIALMSGITALWSGVLIGKLRILGMCIYTGVVLLLVAGTLLDSIILQSESHHYQSGPAFGLSYIMFVVFLLSVLFGWRQFYLLKKQKLN